MPGPDRSFGRRAALGAAGFGISSLILPSATAAASTLGGSSDPSVDVSSDGTLVTTAGADVLTTGGITATAANGKAYRVFDTSAGSFTFKLNGPLVVDVLLIGGGAGGCAYGASGGGAGAISMHLGVSLAAGDHSVTVGAGGLAELVTTGENAGQNSAPENGNGIQPASNGEASTFAVDSEVTYTAAGGLTGLRINGDPEPELGEGWPAGTSPAGTSSGTGASASPGGVGGVGVDFSGDYTGGGGAGAGGNGRFNNDLDGSTDGGPGFEVADFFAAAVRLAGGGGGGTSYGTAGTAADGGGAGGGVSSGQPVAGQAATAFGGGGGSGGKSGAVGAAGGNGFRGLVIVRYAI